ncbi:hypothetical protein VNO78_18064 [Psophocarpus tetragonolobus]|uniref:Uncharacterized protein n=1 Tax=Psophocarpus tetragonolobus TaxID=3891 RepID=A0AAN9SP92_PSOTE
MRWSVILVCVVAYWCVSGRRAEASREQEQLSAYEVLEKYELPVGLLPQGATGYELNEKNGHFTAYLNGTCYFSIESYELKYKSSIKGVISKGKLSKLKGVSVKVEVLWLKIVEVTRHADDLLFSVGIATAAFSLQSFSESPQCGCGFHCNHFHQNGHVSSSL